MVNFIFLLSFFIFAGGSTLLRHDLHFTQTQMNNSFECNEG